MATALEAVLRHGTLLQWQRQSIIPQIAAKRYDVLGTLGGQIMQSSPQPPDNENGTAPLSEVLRQESERLRQLAEECRKQEEYEAEMRANYPYFKRFVYDTLKERALREMPEIPPEKDLETIIQEEGGLPLEAFIDEIEGKPKGS
jgi:hypothetical protein